MGKKFKGRKACSKRCPQLLTSVETDEGKGEASRTDEVGGATAGRIESSRTRGP